MVSKPPNRISESKNLISQRFADCICGFNFECFTIRDMKRGIREIINEVK